jgi:hypothetical protein
VATPEGDTWHGDINSSDVAQQGDVEYWLACTSQQMSWQVQVVQSTFDTWHRLANERLPCGNPSLAINVLVM